MKYIEQWCGEAASYIRFPPDRPPVRQELLEHMTDKYDEYLADGMEPSKAEQRVIREMGSERETGLLLRKIHKPYLGWLWRVTQWAVGIALVLAAFNALRWVSGTALRISGDVETMRVYDVYTDTHREYSGEGISGSSDRVLYLEPNCSDSSDGYTFTVTKAAYWEGTYTDETGTHDSNSFYFLLEVTNPRPWAGYTDTPRWFHAVDSLGNYYYACFEASRVRDPAIVGNGTRTGLCTYTFDMWAENYCSQDAEWLELRYDRDGRDVALRIDLTGGGDA